MSAPRGLAHFEALARLNELGKKANRAVALLLCTNPRIGHKWYTPHLTAPLHFKCMRCGETGSWVPR